MSASGQTLILSVLEHLESLKEDHSTESSDSLETAISNLCTAFGVDLGNARQVGRLSLKPHTLSAIFEAGSKALGAKSPAQQLEEVEDTDAFRQFVKVVSAKGYFKGVEEDSAEYDERMSKLVAKFRARTGAATTSAEEGAGAAPAPAPAPAPKATPGPGSGSVPGPADAKAAKESKAEEIKGKGNKLLMAKDYEGAEKCYTEALELSPSGPNSHVYLCNRAAALCYLGRNDDAVVDCQESIDLNPKYAKAYTRLGYAYFQLEDYEAAVKAYKKSLELDPGNVANSKSLKKAMAKLHGESGSDDHAAESSSRAMPDLSALASMMGGAGAGDAGGSGGGLASLMSAMANPTGGSDSGGGTGSGGVAGATQGNGGDQAGGLNAGGADDGGLASMMSALAGSGGGGGSTPEAGGQGGLASMMAALGGGAGGGDASGNGAGPGGLAGILNNPAMMQQVQSMMSNPQMMQQVQSMMSNPQMMQSIMGMMGGQGGAGTKGSGGSSDNNRSS